MSIGKTLAEARLAAGLTVDQVSETTRVRQALVRAIEQDDFTGCGGDFYARGHIRSLARAVGLDPEPLIARFDESRDLGSAPAPTKMFEPERIRPERRTPGRATVTAALVAAGAVFVAIQVASGRGGEEPEEPARTVRAASTPTASPDATPKAEPSAPPAAAAQPQSPQAAAAVPGVVSVRLHAVDGRSWVRAVDSRGRQLFQNVVPQGDSRDFTDPKKLQLTIGNAGAVRLNVNGQDIGPAGQEGQVVTRTFTTAPSGAPAAAAPAR